MRHLAAVLLAIAVVPTSPGRMHAQVAAAATANPSQTADQTGPAFEVVSLRTDHSAFGNASPLGQNHWSVGQAALMRLMGLAFDLPPSRIVGVPQWGRLERYAVAAKAEDGVILTKETLALCLQRLLADRFKLATHRETEMRKGYALVVAKGGPKMKSTDKAPMKSAIYSGSLHARSVEMDVFAEVLGEALIGQAVVNDTGLAGAYEFTLTFMPPLSTLFGVPFTPPPADSGLPSLYTALEEQLGLKLEPRTLPVEIVVVDHAERPVLD